MRTITEHAHAEITILAQDPVTFRITGFHKPGIQIAAAGCQVPIAYQTPVRGSPTIDVINGEELDKIGAATTAIHFPLAVVIQNEKFDAAAVSEGRITALSTKYLPICSFRCVTFGFEATSD